ncbi:MAG: SRPBCC family protein [Solirubrobacterales bacterium]|nr:SRPBCC family protein [Solirubrobacterales bacterium]
MPEASSTIEIRRPMSEVFAFLADGENDPRWRTGVIDIRRKSGQGRGAIYEQGVKGPFGRRVPADYEITAYEPDRRIGFRAIAGPVRPEGSYELAALDSGATRVTFALRAEPRGLAKLMSPMVTKTMRSEVAQLDRLRAVLEEAGD